MEQKRPADIFQELLDYLWNGLGLEEKGWKRLKKGDFKKKTKNGMTYQIWFDRSRYNYIDYKIGHGNVEVDFTCIIKQGDDYLYSFRMEPTTGGSFFRMLTEDLQLDTVLLNTFLPLVTANYLDFIDRFEVDPTAAIQPVCAPFTQSEDYSWCIHVDEQMVERYGTPEQLAEYHRQSELCGTPEHRAKNWMGSMLFHLSHANDVDQAWASSLTKEELDKVVEPFVQAKRQTRQWTQEDEAGYQLYQQETDPRKRTFRVWYLIANPRGLPKELVQKELEFRWKLFANREEERK
ncbi:spondin [Enterocloster bolteae]|uniref:spondin n=1 Tax=Enterocloster bolteae TaxID=208479 RepID=UPI00189FAF87|nr:spondin [Enterocloster bolteae]